MIRQLLRSLRMEWRRDPLLICLESMGTVVSMIAAIALSFQILTIWWVYWLWCMGSMSLTFTSYKRKNSLLTGLMVFYTILNIIGLWNFV